VIILKRPYPDWLIEEDYIFHLSRHWWLGPSAFVRVFFVQTTLYCNFTDRRSTLYSIDTSQSACRSRGRRCFLLQRRQSDDRILFICWLPLFGLNLWACNSRARSNLHRTNRLVRTADWCCTRFQGTVWIHKIIKRLGNLHNSYTNARMPWRMNVNDPWLHSWATS